jgi:hypothetical protein
VKRRFAAILAAGLLAAAPVAQLKPDFSGSWRRDETKTTTGGGSRSTPAGIQGRSAVPMGLTVVRQTPGSLTTERHSSVGTIVYVFQLDGSESTNKNGAMIMTTRSHWDASRLITEGREEQTTSQGYASWKFKEVRFLDAQGALVIDTTRTPSDGSTSMTHEVFIKTHE